MFHDEIVYTTPESVRDEVMDKDQAVAVLANWGGLHSRLLARGRDLGYRPGGAAGGEGSSDDDR